MSVGAGSVSDRLRFDRRQSSSRSSARRRGVRLTGWLAFMTTNPSAVTAPATSSKPITIPMITIVRVPLDFVSAGLSLVAELSFGETEGAGFVGSGCVSSGVASIVMPPPPAPGFVGSGGGSLSFRGGVEGGAEPPGAPPPEVVPPGKPKPGGGPGVVSGGPPPMPPDVMVVPVKVTPQYGHFVCGENGVVVVPSDLLHLPHVHS